MKRNIEASPDKRRLMWSLRQSISRKMLLPKHARYFQEGFESGDSEAPDLLAQLSIVYTRVNDLRMAQKYLQQAEDIDDEHELVQEARALYNQRRIQQRAGNKPHKPQQNRQNKKKK